MFYKLNRIGRDRLHNHRHTIRVGMNAVRLIERCLRGHSFQEEGIKQHVVLARKVWIDRSELLAIFLTQIWRGQHAGKKDRQATFFQGVQNGCEVLAGLLRLETAQRVIGAKLYNDGIHIVVERPVQARKAPGGGITGYARILEHNAEPCFIEGFLQLWNKALALLEAISSGQACAQSDHFDRLGR